MISLVHWKAEKALVCGTATWQPIAESGLPVADREHVTRLAPRPGLRGGDVATGTGAVALPAARVGAEASALDPPPARVRTVRRLAAKRGLSRLAGVHPGIRACQDRTGGRVARQARDR